MLSVRLACVLAATSVALLCIVTVSLGSENFSSELSVETDLESKSPKQKKLSDYDRWFGHLAPMQDSEKVYIYWGSDVDKYASAKVVHSNVVLDHSPGYIYGFGGQLFRGLSLSCCSTIVFPPFAHGMPIHSPGSKITTRIPRFVAQGNTMIFTGGLIDLEFINMYFQLHIETVANNFSPGPYTRRFHRLPPALRDLNIPSSLRQVGTQATVVDKYSLPEDGLTIIYDDMQGGTPVFILKHCMVNNPKRGEPPFKVNPRSCPKYEKHGNPCGCGNIVYIGFDYRDSVERDWNLLLRGIVEFAKSPPTPSKK